MQENLTIALVQIPLVWKDKIANLSAIERIILRDTASADIFILPEMFTTAFCVEDTSLAEDIQGNSLRWMQQMAQEKHAAICGSILFKEGDNYFNRFFWVQADTTVYTYDKHHLFSLVGEQNLLTRGTKKSIIPYKGWKIQPFICYDIRFPAWCQNDANADVQIYVANWPQKRIHHWKLLLQARAIENQCYVAGVNRLGADFYGNAHNGQSAVFDYTGNKILDCGEEEIIKTVRLSSAELLQHRNRYPFWKDRD